MILPAFGFHDLGAQPWRTSGSQTGQEAYLLHHGLLFQNINLSCFNSFLHYGLKWLLLLLTAQCRGRGQVWSLDTPSLVTSFPAATLPATPPILLYCPWHPHASCAGKPEQSTGRESTHQAHTWFLAPFAPSLSLGP